MGRMIIEQAEALQAAKHPSLAEALAAFQAELPKVRKDETAKVTGESKSGAKISYTYGYAGLDTVVESVLPVLGRHGLSITSRSTFTPEGVFMLEVSLLHDSGERETAYWPLPDPRRVGPQDLGSAYTYGRRYLTLALTGTFPGGEDDDGQKAQATARESWDDAKPVRQHQPAPPAATEPPKPQKTSWTDVEVYDYQAKMGTVSLDSAIKAYDWMAGKDLHNREVGHPDDSGDDKPKMTATTVIAVKLAAAAQDPESTPGAIDGLKAMAADRGLMKVQVSPTATLEEALYEAHELAAHAAVGGVARADTEVTMPHPGDE